MGAKIPQQSSPRHGAHPAATTYRKLLKNGAPNREAHAPIFIRAHIQLAGHNLTNNHTFKLLSGLLGQTLYKENIALEEFLVNPQKHVGGKLPPTRSLLANK